MVEVRWPYWCVGTYFALWNSSPYPQGGYFYGGIAVYGKGEHATPAETEATLRHEVWSFWPSAAYKGERTWIEAVGNPFNGGSMSGEGTEAGIHSGILPFLEPQQWYRQVLRTWPDPHTPETRGYIGWWMEEVASGKWRLVGVVSFPVKVTGLSGNSSFVEATGSSGPGAIDPRIIDRRRAYYRSEGKWHKSDQISQKQEYSTAWQIIDNGSAFRFDCTATATNLPVSFRTNGNNVFVLTNQAAEPELGALKLEACRAIGLGSQLVVDWQVSDRNVPQLSYQLEAYSKPDGGGDLLATVKEALPQVNVKRLDLPGPAASVKLTLRDIFDRPIEKIIPVNPGTPQPAAQATALQPGLDYRYFEGDWKSVPAVEQLVPAKQGRVNTISDSATQGRTKSYAFSFTGYLKVPETGVYTFRLQTCDGSRLTIGPRVVADNDGVHTAITHLSHALLEKGLHPFRLDYFRGPEGIGTPTLLADWAGPNFNYRGIGPEDLVCERAANEPVAVLVPTLKDGNLLSIRQAHQLNGHSFSKLEVFAGKLMLGVIDQPDATPTYVLPAGKQVLWGRLWFNGGHSVDSGEQTIVSTDSRSPSWAYTVPGEQKLPLAVSTSENSVAVTGDGQFFAHREVTGDFTLTARVEDISRSTHENGIAGNSLVGLLASAHPDQLLGQDSFGLWDTAGLGIRGTANDRDLEASGLSRWTLDRDKPWLRITRQGRLWRGYTSTDGHAWTKVAERILAQQPSQYHVGVCFITRPPGQNKTLFSGKVGQITLVPEVAPDPTPAVALPAVRPGRFAGVICDPHSPDTFYVRTAGRGLMKSTDAGATLKPLTLTPLLRTLAVSPTTPAVLLAGTGDGKSGALWRSANGGATWAKTCESLDFDGAGADVLCGETISFSPFVAGQAAAAGASSGLYLSDDDGQTWRCAGLKEEHISVVAFSTKLKGLLIVGTSGTQTAPGRILFSADGGKQFHVFAEKRHWTVTNIAFESMVECENYIHFATSSGVYYCYNLGMYLYQYRHILAPDVPYTAITSWPISQQVGRNRILTAPANGSGTLYNGQIGYYWSVEWQPRNVAPGAAPEEINCLANAGKYGERVYATAANGLFLSRDQGKSFERLQP
jgi:photosystem II stability/assembly factor-like uncharacterized protein